MSDEEIKEIADKLIKSSDESEAFFGFNEDYDNCNIIANKDGLKLFSAELLYASHSDNVSKIWGIQNEWFDDTRFEIGYIQVIDSGRAEKTVVSKKSKLKESILGFMGFLFIGILVTFFIVGTIVSIKTLINWF